MKVCGILSYYDESPHWISTAVSSLGRFCDIVVAHDGSYGLYPGARPRSHPAQAEAAMHAAEAADVACLVYRPKDIYWGNEVEKRNEGLRMAGALLEEDVDWVVVWDADYHLLKCDAAAVRQELEQTECNVATYTLLDGMDYPATSEALERYAQERPLDTEWTLMTRDIFRWHPTLAIGPLHWSVSVSRGKREWLRGPFSDNTFEPLLPCVDLRASLVAYHRTQDRVAVRKEAAKRYYDRRAEADIEDVNECVELMKADVGAV